VDFDLAPLAPALNLIHVQGVMAFVLIHGGSGLVALKVRGERDRARIGSLVDLSSASLGWGWLALGVVFFGGILAGIAGGWWTSGRLWIWASLVIFVVVTLLMTPLASGYMNGVRTALGLPTSQDRRKDQASPTPTSDEELERILRSNRPIAAAVIGAAGIAVLTWLMMAKPF